MVSNARIQQLRICNVGAATDWIAIPESRYPSVQEGLRKIGIEADRGIVVLDGELEIAFLSIRKTAVVKG